MSHSIHSFNAPERSAAGHSNSYTGALSKTQRSSVMVSGAGGHAFAAEVYTQANVTSEPALRQGLLDGSLNTVVDPRSGKRYALAIPVLYHDERLKLFALFLPDALRHQEFQQRRALLERLEALDEPLPAYVRRFFVVFGRMDLEQAEEQCSRVADPRPSTSNEDLNVRIRELDAKEEQLKRERQELSTLRLKLEDQAMRLKEAEAAAQNVLKAHTVEPEVTSRRERVAVEPQVPMVRVSTAAAPAMAPPIFEPDTLVPELIPEEPAPTKRETTMVVSMDMFYTDEGEPLNAIVVDKHSSEDGVVEPLDVAPERFNRLRANGRSHYHHTPDGEPPLLSMQLESEQLARLEQGQASLYLQLHDRESFPLVLVLIAIKDDRGQVLDDMFWPVDVRRPADRRLLVGLADNFALKIALYDTHGACRKVLSFVLPLELNAQHILSRAELRLKQVRGPQLNFERALSHVSAPDYERLGEMKHNFDEGSFDALLAPAEIRLAAGIVGYWSTPDVFRYLIENRSFSLSWFGRIQERVVMASVQHGIALSSELLQVGVEMELAPDQKTLLRRLASTWAQVSLGLGGTPNDLEPIGSWENWQDLIEAMRTEHIALEPDLDELAKASLRRAQTYAQDHGLMSGLTPSLDSAGRVSDHEAAPPLQEQLSDPDRRLAAAEAILRRGDSSALVDVLVAAEQMTREEFDRLVERLSAQAHVYERALLGALELPNPTVALLCCLALSSIRSARALPPLLEALQDPARVPDPQLFAASMSMYGSRLVEPLGAALTHVAHPKPHHPWVVLLAELSRAEGEAILERMKDRAPQAVQLVRQQRRSST